MVPEVSEDVSLGREALVDSIRLTSTFDEVDYDTYRYRDDDYKYY